MDLFCARHYITLQAAGSPFLKQEIDSLSPKDLFVAMRVCSTKSWVHSIQKPSVFDRFRYLLIDSIPERQTEAFIQFGKYIAQSMSVPKVWIKDTKNDDTPKRPTNLPETLSMVVILMTKFGFSEEEAWNMPFAKAIWYSTAYASQEGAEISIITTEQEDTEDEDLKKLKEFEDRMRQLAEMNIKKMRR